MIHYHFLQKNQYHITTIFLIKFKAKTKNKLNKYRYLSILILLHLIAVIDRINYQIDDVFISLRYVWNLVHGNGMVFNIGERIESFSNPTWILLISLISFVTRLTEQWEILIISKALGVLLSIFTIVILYKLGKKYINNDIYIFFILLIYAFNPYISTFASSGMETPLIIFLMTISLYFLDEVYDGRNFIWLGLAIGFLSISRPEGIIYPVSFYSFYLVKYNILKSPGKKVITSFCISIIIFISYLIFRIFYYNDYLSLAAYAKNDPSLSSFFNGCDYFFKFLMYNIPIVAILLISSFNQNKLSKYQFSIIFLIISQILFSIYSGGDWMRGFRFLIVIYPAIIIFLYKSSTTLYTITKKVYFTLTLLTIFTFITGRIFYKQTYHYYPLNSGFKELNFVNKSALDISKKISGYAKDEDLILLSEAGAVPYFSDNLHYTDVFGLLNTHIAKNIKGHHFRRIDPEYFKHLNYKFLIVFNLNGKYIPFDEIRKDMTECKGVKIGVHQIDQVFNEAEFYDNFELIYNNEMAGIFKRK